MERGGWTQERLVARSGLSRDTISSLLNQKQDPREDTLATLAVSLGVPVPRVELVVDRPPESPLSLVRDALQVLSRAEEQLAAATSRGDVVGGAAAMPPFGHVTQDRKVERVLQVAEESVAPYAAEAGRPPKGKPGARRPKKPR
jgi:transcriptional regulator with XRE-family HTH domain